ncbi:hypothetical protein BGZ72_003673, partial [Mortierella alpina]
LMKGIQWKQGEERVPHCKKVFVVIYLEQHCRWGAACFDLDKQAIAFGDSSKGYPVPLDELSKVVEWLKPLTGPEMWDEALANVQLFKVPQHQNGMSCGIMATIAIEQAVNG